MAHRILTQELAQLLFLVVALSMALTPFLAELGQKIGKAFDSHDMKARGPRRPVSLSPVSAAQHGCCGVHPPACGRWQVALCVDVDAGIYCCTPGAPFQRPS